MKKRVVYTAIFNNYDSLCPIYFKSKIKFICFTDNKDLNVKGWEIIYLNIKDLKYADKNRNIKMFPNIYLKNFTESLYIDGNIRVKKDPEVLFDKYLKNNFLIIPKHTSRNCIYEEAKFIKFAKKLNKNEIEVLEKQISSYFLNGMPKNYGLWENNIILRKNNHPQNINLSKLWWQEYMRGCKRDQISLPYIIWLEKIKIGLFLETPRLNNVFFEFELHNSSKTINIFSRLKLLANIRQKQSLIYSLTNFLFNLISKIASLFK